MEWINEIIKKHTKEDGTVDTEAAMKEINETFPQHAVPKDQYNNVSNQLKDTNKTLKDLQSKTKDNPDIQKQLQEAQDAQKAAEEELKNLQTDVQVMNGLREAGAKDLEYAKFKLGSVEVDKEGKVKDLDSKIKDLQKELPDQFGTSDEEEKGKETSNPSAPGYKAIDNKLDKGKTSVSYSFDQLEKLTPQEINDNWDAVQTALEQGGNE